MLRFVPDSWKLRYAGGNSGRFQLLDAARGLACLGVVFYHQEHYDDLIFPLNLYGRHGDLGVPMFFVVSGYCVYAAADRLASRDRPAVSFLMRRFWRIYPAYWASLAAAIFVRMAWFHRDFGLRDLLGNVLLIQPYLKAYSPLSLYWTLVYEQQFYIVLGLLLLPPLIRWRRQVILISGIWASLRVWNLLPTVPWTNWLFLPCWLEFALGSTIFLALHQKPWRRFAIPVLAMEVIAALTARNELLAGSSLGARGHFAVAGAFAILMLLLYPLDEKVGACLCYRPFRFLGSISYSLYLTHPLTLITADRAMRRMSITGEWTVYWTGIVAALAAATVFWHFMERPFMHGFPTGRAHGPTPA